MHEVEFMDGIERASKLYFPSPFEGAFCLYLLDHLYFFKLKSVNYYYFFNLTLSSIQKSSHNFMLC